MEEEGEAGVEHTGILTAHMAWSSLAGGGGPLIVNSVHVRVSKIQRRHAGRLSVLIVTIFKICT